MPKLKICLPDINVWVALASDRHVHHDAAAAWFGGVENGGAAFCRISQMGLLRLVTNRHVMGADVVTQKEAWQVYEKLARDQRIVFLPEPAAIENEWKQLTQGNASDANLWTDAYLAAFAMARGMNLVSFDQGFKKLSSVETLILV